MPFPPLLRTTARILAGLAVILAGALLGTAACAQSARINSLGDVDFGTVTSVQTDQSLAQSICVYSTTQNYSITATGSGSGGAFSMTNGSQQLAYTVQWSFSSGQTTGIQLASGQSLSGSASFVNNLLCGLNVGSSASLIVGLRASDLGAARAGAYTGTLTLLVSPN